MNSTLLPRLSLQVCSKHFFASIHVHRPYSTTMTSRRSARLSASNASASPAPEQASVSMPPPKAPVSRKRKASTSAPTEPPKTPTKRRAPVPPPATPTPAAIGLMTEPAGLPATPSPSKARNRRVARLADPQGTNAPLISPETSRVISWDPVLLDAPVAAAILTPTKKADPELPVKVELPTATNGDVLTTATILDEANAHLIRVEPKMRPLVEGNYCKVFSPEGLAERIDPFESLASGIISQQVSGAAAKAIKGRFVALFNDDQGDVMTEIIPGNEDAARGAESGVASNTRPRFPHPSEVAATSIEKLRTAGLSQRKAEYLQGLAEKFSTGELSAQMLADAPYEELFAKLTAVRGIGIWSAEMFACFGLKRMDVFSLGDLGVQRGMAAFVGRDVAKLKSKGGKWKYMSEKEMSEMAERFRPYRSLFMWYMWRVEETDISTME